MLQTAQLLPLQGLSTLGFDPARYQTEPPACYRASWQLPGRDSHPLATTSLCSDQVTPSTPSESLGTRRGSRRSRHGWLRLERAWLLGGLSEPVGDRHVSAPALASPHVISSANCSRLLVGFALSGSGRASCRSLRAACSA